MNRDTACCDELHARVLTIVFIDVVFCFGTRGPHTIGSAFVFLLCFSCLRVIKAFLLLDSTPSLTKPYRLSTLRASRPKIGSVDAEGSTSSTNNAQLSNGQPRASSTL